MQLYRLEFRIIKGIFKETERVKIEAIPDVLWPNTTYKLKYPEGVGGSLRYSTLLYKERINKPIKDDDGIGIFIEIFVTENKLSSAYEICKKVFTKHIEKEIKEYSKMLEILCQK